jgi:type I restriction enzyme, S subunit
MRTYFSETTLEAICTRITDGSHNSPRSVDQGLPMASVKDLTPYGISLDTCRHISEEDFATLIRQGCQPIPGDVLVAKDGASALETVCEFKRPINVVLLSSIAILRPDPTKITSSYLRYYMDCETTRQYLKSGFVTGAAIPRVVLKDFKRCRVFLPPMSLQH